MAHLLKPRRQIRTDPLCRRIGVVHLGMGGLERLKLFHEHVEIGIADFGQVGYIIIIVVPV